ncbi:hypothetical protein KY366_00995, partial [Candidatus Woesearchaeota archaeon]|nr:hypothetical protein [Candidatus Woesearchaeota archaeon]
VTQITITTVTQTQTWQGYYGDIVGTITLDDAQNHTMYDWYAAEPQGEVYAASQEVTNWLTVHCFNYTNNGSRHTYTWDSGARSTTTTNVLNLTELETGNLAWSLGLLSGDYDGVDETFNVTGTIVTSRTSTGYTYEDHAEFFVGTINISAGSCPATNTYESVCVNKTDPNEQNQFKVDNSFCGSDPDNYKWDGTEDGNNFQEVLLTVNDSETIIYTTIIENRRGDNDTDIIGFDNETHDFQLLVGDDGHAGPKQDTSTPYYFYVEIE